MASNIRKILKFLCVTFLINCVQTTYISYYIQYHCNEHPDRRILISDEGDYSALILRSSNGQTISNQKCKVKIVGQNIAGFVATVEHISLNSNNCDNYLKFDNSIKWCDEKDVKSVTVNKNEFDIEFGTGSNSTSQFELVITTFTGIWNRTCPKTNNIRCHGGKQQCIYNGFECDGHSNCPLGSDEKECPTLTTLDEELPEAEEEGQFQTNGTTQSSNSSLTTSNTPSSTVNITSTTRGSNSSSTTEQTSIYTTNKTETSSSSTTLKPKPTDRSSTFWTTVNSTTTQKPTQPTTPKPMSGGGGGTALLTIGIIIVVAFIIGSAIYVYRQLQANNRQETLYSPL